MSMPRLILLMLTALLTAGLCGPTAMAAPHAKAKPKAAAVSPSASAPAPSSGIDTQAAHAIIVEVETGAVLLDKGADERMPPASMSKMMTAYVVFGMLKDGKAKLTDELPGQRRRVADQRLQDVCAARRPDQHLRSIARHDRAIG